MEENNEETNIQVKKRRFSTKKVVRNSVLAVLALSVGYIHYKYVSHLFENDRNFSYLSDLEREMSLRTEMGFYYSYYKTIVEERPFVAGITKLMYDRLVEYPKDVNAFNRFNIHPEVTIGALYRYLEPYLNTSRHVQCHTVDRGEGLAPVTSCVGLGVPVYFYLEAIWWMAGLTVAAIFLHAASLSQSVAGGLLAVAQYFANHSECTRVQWAPNERENLAAPLLVLQMWLVGAQLRDRGAKAPFQFQVFIIFLLNCACLLFWQFTQFIFLTQTAIFFMMEQLRIIDLKTLCIFLHSHFCGLHMAVLLLQGNDMLKSSLYASFFLVVSAYCLFFSSLKVPVRNKFDLLAEVLAVVLRVCLVLLASLYLKKFLSDVLEVEEDSHVWDILFSKLTTFKSFHTLIYTCSDVFDFLPFSSLKKMTLTSLIPFVLCVVVNLVNYWAITAYEKSQKKETEDEKSKALEKDEDTDDSGIENNTDSKQMGEIKDLDAIDKKLKSKIDSNNMCTDKLVLFLNNLNIEAELFYNISQMFIFGVMAALVMRLKLLFTTQMCIVSSLLFSSKYYILPKWLTKYLPFFWILCLSPLIQGLFENISQELSYIGEFSDINQEQLLEWISRETRTTASFAGSLPILSAVMLSTRRPVVAHPHYEHKEARDRAYAVYKVYGKFSSHQVYQELTKLRATHLILENKYCYGRSSKNCSFEDIWDIEAPTLRDSARLCHTLLTQPVEHFYQVFRNDHYAVFRVHDVSVRYMPRSFDT